MSLNKEQEFLLHGIQELTEDEMVSIAGGNYGDNYGGPSSHPGSGSNYGDNYGGPGSHSGSGSNYGDNYGGHGY